MDSRAVACSQVHTRSSSSQACAAVAAPECRRRGVRRQRRGNTSRAPCSAADGLSQGGELNTLLRADSPSALEVTHILLEHSGDEGHGDPFDANPIDSGQPISNILSGVTETDETMDLRGTSSSPNLGGSAAVDLILGPQMGFSGVGSPELEPLFPPPKQPARAFADGLCCACSVEDIESDDAILSADGCEARSNGRPMPSPPAACDIATRSSGDASAVPFGPYTRDQRGHCRYLQHFFRRTNAVRQRCWTREGLTRLAVWRPSPSPACAHGLNLAPPSRFAEQRRRAQACFAWYAQYVRVLKRFQSGMTPLVLDICCKAGGASEGASPTLACGGTQCGLRAAAAFCGSLWRPVLHSRRRFRYGGSARSGTPSESDADLGVAAVPGLLVGTQPGCIVECVAADPSHESYARSS